MRHSPPMPTGYVIYFPYERFVSICQSIHLSIDLISTYLCHPSIRLRKMTLRSTSSTHHLRYDALAHSSYDYVDFCDAHHLPGLGDISGKMGMIWRFMPLADPTVSRFIVRDLDSLLNQVRSGCDQFQNELPRAGTTTADTGAFNVMPKRPKVGCSP